MILLDGAERHQGTVAVHERCPALTASGKRCKRYAAPLSDVCRAHELRPFAFEHFVEWAGRLILDGGDLWEFEPFQLEFVDDVFEGYRRIRHDATRSRVQIVAADDRTGDGIIPTLCLLDELYRHKDLSLYRIWLGKLGKRGAQLVVISTARVPGSDFKTTREELRRRAERLTRRRGSCFTRAHVDGFVLHEWAVAEGADVHDLELVAQANPFSHVTPATLVEKHDSPSLTEGHWRRFVCNLPTRSALRTITEAEWYALETSDEIPAGTSIWAGLRCRLEMGHNRLGVSWAGIGLWVDQRSLSVTADTYSHVLPARRCRG